MIPEFYEWQGSKCENPPNWYAFSKLLLIKFNFLCSDKFISKQTNKKRQRLSMQNSCIIYFQPIYALVDEEDSILS